MARSFTASSTNAGSRIETAFHTGQALFNETSDQFGFGDAFLNGRIFQLRFMSGTYAGSDDVIFHGANGRENGISM